MNDNEQGSRGGFIRRAVIRNPKLELEGLHEMWKKAKMSGGLPDMQQLYSGRATVKKKYGLKDLAQIPIKNDGEVNKSELVRFLLKKNPKLTYRQVFHYMSQDGFTCSPQFFATIVSTKERKQSFAKKQTTSPDPNQHKGPRARLKRKIKKQQPQKQPAMVNDPIALIRGVRDLAEQAGGMANLKELVDVLTID